MEPATIPVEDLEIEAPKVAYLATKGVTVDDVYEVFWNAPRYAMSPGVLGPRFAMLGPNRAARYLLVAIAPMDNVGRWRVITAYWLRESRGRKNYERLVQP